MAARRGVIKNVAEVGIPPPPPPPSAAATTPICGGNKIELLTVKKQISIPQNFPNSWKALHLFSLSKYGEQQQPHHYNNLSLRGTITVCI